MIIAQPVNPGGLLPSFGSPCCLGTFVVDPAGAMRTAINSGTMGDVRLILLSAALVYHEILTVLITARAPESMGQLYVQRKAEIEAIAVEAGALASNLPAKVPFGTRVEIISGLVARAQTDAIQFSVKEPLSNLFKTAGDVQARIEAATRPAPEPPEAKAPGKQPSIIIPAMLTGALLAVLGTAFYLSRRQ